MVLPLVNGTIFIIIYINLQWNDGEMWEILKCNRLYLDGGTHASLRYLDSFYAYPRLGGAELRGGAPSPNANVRRHNKPVIGKMNWIGNTWLSDWREVVICRKCDLWEIKKMDMSTESSALFRTFSQISQELRPAFVFFALTLTRY